MAAIPSISLAQDGVFSVAFSTLTASDTITIASNQYLMFHNDTVGSLTALVDGAGSTAKQVAGVGLVDTSGGVSVVVPAGQFKVVNVNSRSEFFKGVVTITGAVGLKLAVLNA